ncbi:4748_t:CDS:2, partial [Scutellospora calospora]
RIVYGIIYVILIISSYAFLIYGFFVAIRQVDITPASKNNTSIHFLTSHGLIGVVLIALLYVMIPILAITSCVTIRKFGSYTSAKTTEDSELGEHDTSFKSRIALFLNLKNSEADGKQPKSFEVSRPGNQNESTRHQSRTSMLNKPSTDSWIGKRKSVTIADTPTFLNATSRNNGKQNGIPNSRRTSQSTATGSYHQRIDSNGAPTMTQTFGNSHYDYPQQRPNSLQFHSCAGYPRGKNSILVALMGKFGGRGDVDEYNDTNGGLNNDENSQASGSEFGGTDSRFNSINNRANLLDDEMSEEAKQAELEQEIISREVVVMTIPKRRLTVVNA